MITETLPVLSITEPTEVEVFQTKLNQLKEMSILEKNRDRATSIKMKLFEEFIDICQDRYQISQHHLSLLSDRELLLLYNEIRENLEKNYARSKKINRFALGCIWSGIIVMFVGFASATILNSMFGLVLLAIGAISFGTGLFYVDEKSRNLKKNFSLFLLHQELKELGYWQENQDEKLLKLLKPATETIEGGGR